VVELADVVGVVVGAVVDPGVGAVLAVDEIVDAAPGLEGRVDDDALGWEEGPQPVATDASERSEAVATTLRSGLTRPRVTPTGWINGVNRLRV
jgi:hypothetical protein